MAKCILVLGATGILGGAVVRRLQADDLTGCILTNGEIGDPTAAKRILGAPAITLAAWLAQRQTAHHAILEREVHINDDRDG